MLGCDIAFSCQDSPVLLCRDDVATEVSMSRLRRPRQEVRCRTLRVATCLVLVGFLCCDRVFLCRNRVWSRPRILMSRQIIFVSQQSLVKTKSFHIVTKYFCVAIEFSQDQEFLCRDKIIFMS